MNITVSPETTPTNTPDLMLSILDKAITEVIKELYPPVLVTNPEKFSFTSPQYRPVHRNTALNLHTLTRFIISMDGGSIDSELIKAGIKAKKSAFVQPRGKLDEQHFWYVFKAFNHFCEEVIDEPTTFNGYHVYAVDGTTINIARNPETPSFVQHAGAPNGYNQLHATVLFDVMNKLYLDCFLQDQPQQDEIAALLSMLPWNFFPEKSVIVGDRGFESYNVYAHFIERENIKFLIRMKQEKTSQKIIRHLPMTELDEDVEGEITTTQTKDDRERDRIFIQTHSNLDREYSGNTRAGKWDFPSPYRMKFRVVRIRLDTGEYETLATNLPREDFTLDDLRDLYHARWGIETAFRELKYGLGLVNLHGRSEDFVRQEIYAAFTMANFCSRIVSQVVLENRKNAKYAYAVDMKMAVNLIKQYLRNPNTDGNKLMHEIATYTEPVRLGRSDERKIQPKSFGGFTYRVRA